MRRIQSLTIFAAILIVLTLSWLICAEYSAREDHDQAQTFASTGKSGIALTALEGEINRISYDYDEELLSFELRNGVWCYAPDNTVPIRTQLVHNMVEMFDGLTATRAIEAVAGENYGFDEGSFTVEVGTDAGETLRLTFGGINPATSQVYARLDNAPTLYLLDAALPELFDYHFLDILTPDAPPDITSRDLDCITISRGERTLELYYSEEAVETAYSSAFNWFVGRPYDVMTPADTIKSHQLFADVTNLYIYGVAAFRPDADELTEMGLADPAAVITVDYVLDGVRHQSVLNIGSSNADARTHVQYADSEMVLLVDANLMESIIYTSGSSLLPDAVCLIEQETVQSFSVMQGDTMREYVLTDKGDELTQEVWVCNDDPIDSALISNFFSFLNDMTSIKDAPDTTPGEAYASIRFLRSTNNFQDMTLTFHHYDADMLLVSFDNRTRLLVSVEEVDSLFMLLDGAYLHESE